MSRNIIRNPGAGLLLIVGLTAASGLGRDIHVATNGPGGGTPLYSTWDTASSNIQSAVNVATNGDTVLISNGTYYLTSQITVSSNITIRGLDTGDKPVVNGSNVCRCFSFTTASTSVLDNLIITRGYAANGAGVYLAAGAVRNCIIISNETTLGKNGGGVYILGSPDIPATISNCTISHNIAYEGGGIYVHSSKTNVLITDCFIQNNTATNPAGNYTGGGGATLAANNLIYNCTIRSNVAASYAGGIKITGSTMDKCTINCNTSRAAGGGVFMSADAIVTNCVISGNTSTNGQGGGGGGISVRGGNSLVINCRFYDNKSLGAGAAGGAIALGDSAMVKNCIITNNHTDPYDVGGIYLAPGNAVNCLIAYNTAVRRGGGVAVRGASSVINCTIVSNTTPGVGGGMWLYQENNGTGLVENTICYFNQAAGSSNYSHWSGHAFIYHNSCTAPAFTDGSTNFAVNNIFVDPNVVGKDVGNWRLQKQSLCINTGTNQGWMSDAVDLDGHRRKDGFSGLVDMGCYEYLSQGSMYLFE